MTESSDSLLVRVTPPFVPEAGYFPEYYVSYWENTTSTIKRVRFSLIISFVMPLWLRDMSQCLLAKQQKWRKKTNVTFSLAVKVTICCLRKKS